MQPKRVCIAYARIRGYDSNRPQPRRIEWADMFNPKEAHEDRFIQGAALSVLIAVGCCILLVISFGNGLRYALVLQDSVEVEGVVITNLRSDEPYKGGRVLAFRFDDLKGNRHEGVRLFRPDDASDYRSGQSIDVVFNPRFPMLYTFADKVDLLKTDFIISVILVTVVTACFLYIIYQFFGYVRFKKRMRYY